MSNSKLLLMTRIMIFWMPVCIAPLTLYAESGALAAEPPAPATGIVYSAKPDLWAMVKSYPSDYSSFFSNLTAYDATTYAAVGAATVVLLPFDQRLAHGTKQMAIRNKIMTGKPEYRSVDRFTLLGNPMNIEVPNTPQGYIWYLGDGMFSLELVGIFAGYSLFSDDNRAAHVSAQIVESLFISGPTVLAIKVVTGRESPAKATRFGGHWNGYPGILPYARDQSRYYSFPSGHTATAVSTLTIITENYADKAWIAPVGDVMVGLLMVSLMNVGSHWASDFPVAILIGYTSAHTVVTRDRARDQEAAQQHESTAISGKYGWKGLKAACFGIQCGLESVWLF